MDRLDTWLNAQRGWRRLAIIGVTGYMPTVCLGFGVAVFSSSWPPVPMPAIVAIAVLAIPVAVGSGLIMAMIYSRRARSPKRKTGLPPFLMWRQIALTWAFLPNLINALTPRNRALLGLQLIFTVIVIALAAEAYRYSRRFTRSPGAVESAALADE